MRVITERVVGYFPISIATSLALESLVGLGLDENGIKWTGPNQSKPFESIWLNVRTLIRNTIGAIEGVDTRDLRPSDIALTVSEDISFISDVLKEYAPHLKVQLYYCEHNLLSREFPSAKLREPSTEKQKIMYDLTNKTWSYIKSLFVDNDLKIKTYSRLIDRASLDKSLMITHIPADLLSHRYFRELTLLESHTGALKDKALWHTKLQNAKDLNMLPFNKITLQIFGDSELISPARIQLRRIVVQIAVDNKWSFLTTTDKIKFNFERYKDKDIVSELLSYTRSS